MQASLVQLVVKNVDVFAKISQLHCRQIQHKHSQMSFYKCTQIIIDLPL